MALFPKTPGVYVQEISTLPASVAAVPTSVPVFIGYTEKAVIDGANWDFTNKGFTDPIRIESLLEFQSIFGKAYPEKFTATLSGPNVDVTVTDTVTSGKDFRLFYNLMMYFGNGGAPCYIISVNTYSAGNISDSDLKDAIAKAEKVDEITMVLIPDAMSASISNSSRSAIYDTALAHCAKMQDRFAILDVAVDTSNTITGDSTAFRNSAVGANNLSYGAAYYPSYAPLFSFLYSDIDVSITATALNLPASVLPFNGGNLTRINNGVKASGTVTFGSGPYSGTLRIGPPTSTFTLSGSSPATEADALALAINSSTTLQSIASASSDGVNTVTITAIAPGISGNSVVFTLTTGVGVTISGSGMLAGGIDPDKNLYNKIKSAIDSFDIELYPSSAMAGVYCSVDASRGIWKAPANTGINLIKSLHRNISDEDQSGLNVDATSGKSIDAIREFPGRGKLVWGARTLDGNSNEWRYVNVRRTFLFIEDSCKKATEFVVFEPNDKNTWLRVKSMISSFLTNLWRDGALAGDKPDQAFFVRLGLGETMTAQDILEGRMIVQIGLAVVRPAEFIILQFEHKLQEA